VTVPEFPLPTPKREGTKKKQQPPKDSRRDLSDVVKERTTRKDGTVRPDAEMPPRDMPLGPWPTLEAAIRELKTWAATQGFSLISTSGMVEPTSKKGATKRFACTWAIQNRSTATKKETLCKSKQGIDKCPFHVVVEESKQGWAVVRGDFTHCEHKLDPTNAPKLGADRGIKQVRPRPRAHRKAHRVATYLAPRSG